VSKSDLKRLAHHLLFSADLNHVWTDGRNSHCKLCGDYEIDTEITEDCDERIEQLMLDFAEQAFKQGLFNVS